MLEIHIRHIYIICRKTWKHIHQNVNDYYLLILRSGIYIYVETERVLFSIF